MEIQWVEMSAVLADCIIVTWFLHSIFEHKMKHQIVCNIAKVVYVTLLFIDGIMASSHLLHNSISLVFMMVISMIYMTCFMNGLWYRKVISILIYALINLISSTCSMVIVEASLGIDIHELLLVGSYPRTVLLVIQKLLQALLLYVIWKLQKRERLYTRNKDIMLIAVLLFFSFLLSQTMWYLIWDKQDPTIPKVFLLEIIILNTTVYAIYKRVRSTYEKEAAFEMQEQIYQAQTEWMEEVEKHYGESLLLRHDIKNYLLVSNEYLEKGDIQGAREYQKKLLEQMSGCRVTNIHTDNTAVDAILNTKFSKCHELGIAYTYQLKASCAQFEQSAISILLANMLDNAIEATLRTENPSISVRIYDRQGHVIIECKNTKAGLTSKVDGDYITTKTSEKNHGFGLKSMKQASSMLKGELVIDETEDEFSVTIFIKDETMSFVPK